MADGDCTHGSWRPRAGGAGCRDVLRAGAVGQWEFDAEKADAFTEPILFVLGSDSFQMLREGGDLVHSWFPRTEDYVVRGVNHGMLLQDPRSIAAGLARFLN